MPWKIGHVFLFGCLSLSVSTAIADEDAKHDAVTLADTRVELGGRWQGQLEYRDYQSDRWFGIPVTLDVRTIDGGATVIRIASFDDGDSGTVYITTVSMLAPDDSTEYVGSFRADRPAELGTVSLRFADMNGSESINATHWTVVAETDGMDDNRPATIRETTRRNGPNLVTLKEVDYSDDDKEEWLQRNRTTIEKVAQ